MFLINCPYCGERDQSEFKAGGEAHIIRPKQPTELSDDEWAEYLFMRKNIKGIQFERWNHTHGCRKWFNVVRDTSNEKNNQATMNRKMGYLGNVTDTKKILEKIYKNNNTKSSPDQP